MLMSIRFRIRLKLFFSKRLLQHSCFHSFTVHEFKSDFKFPHTLSLSDSRLLIFLSNNDLEDARQLLDEMPLRGYSSFVVRWTSLLSNYAKHGFITEARKLLDIMPERNVVSFNSMLSAYVHNGMLNDARHLFALMPEKNVVSWTSMLCGLMNAGQVGEAWALFKAMPVKNVVSWNSLIVGLIRNGYLEDGRRFFNEMPLRNQISWNVMIAGYAENSRMDEARALFDNMHDKNVVTWTTMIAGYCRDSNVEEGINLFERMPERNIVSWTAMIGGFAWNGSYKQALLYFLKMKIDPNGETFISVCYACAGLILPTLGKQIHAQLITRGWFCVDYDGRLLKSLIHMYSVCGVMNHAYRVFTEYSGQCDVLCWNYMINGYIGSGQLENAEYLFDKMPVRDHVSWTSMISGYLIAGNLSKAYDIFRSMPNKDSIAWTTMISGLSNTSHFIEATILFMEMRSNRISSLNSTYSVLLGASGALANLDLGRQLHGLVLKTFCENDVCLDNSLISMYSKCGDITNSYKVFSNMTFRDLISWNSMIMGLSYFGLAVESINLFETMQKSGVVPNSVTFLGILSACNHAGLIGKGCEFFGEMSELYSVKPGLEHYISMINLVGRSGNLNEAEMIAVRSSFEFSEEIWGALLGVCGVVKKNDGIAERTANKVLELDPVNVPAHVALCNVYAANGQHGLGETMWEEMGLKGLKKVPGCSWILVKGTVHVFFSGDRSHPQLDQMFSFLLGILNESKLFSGFHSK